MINFVFPLAVSELHLRRQQLLARIEVIQFFESIGRLDAASRFLAIVVARHVAKVRTRCLPLASCPLRHVCFTNSPRKYGIRCLEALGIRQFFKDADIFAVDDVLRLSGGACKPEAGIDPVGLGRSGPRTGWCCRR